MCAEGRDFHVVSLQTGLRQVGLALQERRRALHPVAEVVVVVTESSLHADYSMTESPNAEE